jgi:hypothetical protein
MFIRISSVRFPNVLSVCQKNIGSISLAGKTIDKYQDDNVLNSHNSNLKNQLSCNFTHSLKPGLYYLNPRHIYYTQPNVSLHFNDGRELNLLIDSIKRKTITPENIPTIQVVEYNDRYYSLDNRRLCAFKSAGLDNIPVQILSMTNDEYAMKRFKQRFDPIHGIGKYTIICSYKDKQKALASMRDQGVIKGIEPTSGSKTSKKSQCGCSPTFFQPTSTDNNDDIVFNETLSQDMYINQNIRNTM